MDALAANELQSRAQAALASSPIPELKEIIVESFPNGLVIRGVVSSFYHKQLAQETVRLVLRDLQFVNSVEVR